MGELRNKVYYWTLDLIKEGKVSEGLILMLSTWNFAYFRYHIKTFDLDGFEKQIKKCDFDYFKNKKFEEINLEDKEIQERMKNIYDSLSSFSGVRYVGATKIMHFLCPDVFMMWDKKIIEKYKANTSPDGYVKFMKEIQSMYRKNSFENLDQTVSIPRAIDIYNMKKYSEA